MFLSADELNRTLRLQLEVVLRHGNISVMIMTKFFEDLKGSKIEKVSLKV